MFFFISHLSKKNIKFIRHDKNSSDKRKQISIITSINPIYETVLIHNQISQIEKKEKKKEFYIRMTREGISGLNLK